MREPVGRRPLDGSAALDMHVAALQDQRRLLCLLLATAQRLHKLGDVALCPAPLGSLRKALHAVLPAVCRKVATALMIRFDIGTI